MNYLRPHASLEGIGKTLVRALLECETVLFGPLQKIKFFSKKIKINAQNWMCSLVIEMKYHVWDENVL